MISIQQQNDMSTYKKLFNINIMGKMWRPNVKGSSIIINTLFEKIKLHSQSSNLFLVYL
jgi:hypothetical protein